MKRIVVALAVLNLIAASAAVSETVTGKYKWRVRGEPNFVFWPDSTEKVELTLMWFNPSAKLDLAVSCFDEIGSEYLTLLSESNHDRIEHLEFGGWSGGTCIVTIRAPLVQRNTKYLLNLQGSSDRGLEVLESSHLEAARTSAVPLRSAASEREGVR